MGIMISVSRKRAAATDLLFDFFFGGRTSLSLMDTTRNDWPSLLDTLIPRLTTYKKYRSFISACETTYHNRRQF